MKYIQLTEDRIEELCGLWNRELGASLPMRSELLMHNSFLDINRVKAGSWMALDESTDDIVGFVVAKAWNDTDSGIEMPLDLGWIQLLLVDSRYRSQGVGDELLTRAEKALQDRGIRRIDLGSDMHWRMFPGVPLPDSALQLWLEKRGYVNKGTSYDLWREYESNNEIALPALEGVTVRLLNNDSDDKARIHEFMERCFPGRWTYLTQQYWERGGTGREFVVLEKNGQIIGFCRINDASSPYSSQNTHWAPLFKEELGGVGPLGIDPDYQGLGYGLAVVQSGIYCLRERGIKQIVIDATGIPDFYIKMGYSIWKTYTIYRKDY